MDQSLFSEEHLRDYASGNFTGNKAALEDYLSRNESARKQIALYRTLHKLIKEENIPSLSPDFAVKLTRIIEAQKKEEIRTASLWKNVALYSLGSIFLIALIFTFRYWFTLNTLRFSNLFFWASAGAIIIFVYLFNDVEMKRSNTIFRSNQPQTK